MKSNRISTNILVALTTDGRSFEEVQNFKYLVTSSELKGEISEEMHLNIAAGNK
jgi:hypothetical protein